MHIVVPIVASYPDRKGVFRNARLCREAGHKVYLDAGLRKKGRFSDWESYGTPEGRARSLEKLLLRARSDGDDGKPILVATATGGYGSMRMLHRMAKAEFRDTVAVGFSDSTAVAVFSALCSRYPSFHGPCFEDREFMEALPYYTFQKSFWRTPLTFAERMPAVALSGIAWGGNLTTFGYMVDEVKRTLGSFILFMEDVYDEKTYPKVDVGALVEMEFDRLEYAGIFERTVAVLVGRFPRVRRPDLLKSLRKFYKGPVAGLDIGHAYGHRPWALMPPIPLGANVVLLRKGNDLVCGWSVEGLSSPVPEAGT